MAMHGKGLVKLVEECGELSQIAAKKLNYMDTDNHPDGKGSMLIRLQEEIADVLAATQFVSDKFGLDRSFIKERSEKKLALFCEWDKKETNEVFNQPCESCNRSDGTFIQNGFHRCKTCGHPGQ